MYKVKVTTFYVLHFRFIFIYFLNVTISSDSGLREYRSTAQSFVVALQYVLD